MIEKGVASCLLIDALSKDFFCLRAFLKEGGAKKMQREEFGVDEHCCAWLEQWLDFSVGKRSGESKSATSCECCCEDVSEGAQIDG